MRTLMLFVVLSACALGQDLTCHGNQCVASDGKTTTVCTQSYLDGDITCHTSDPNSNYNSVRAERVRAYVSQGMSLKAAEKKADADHDEVMREDAGELKARHELCDVGVLKGQRCDFSRSHGSDYIAPQQETEAYHEGTPEELQNAVKSKTASQCTVYTWPVDAEVFVDGLKINKDKIFILLKKDKPRVIVAKLPGYKTSQQEVTPDGDIIPLGFMLEKDTESIDSKTSC